MIGALPPNDPLAELIGRSIPASSADFTYEIGPALGSGATAVTFAALLRGGGGSIPVVLKVMHPNLVARSNRTAMLAVRKEAVALGRLNERVPPTPFVVRLVDTGAIPWRVDTREFELPWLAIERVHGGAEGTTLAARIAASIASSGYAFDMARAALAIECIAHGLVAVHDVGVVHRDVKPENVLCCGFGDHEMFKVSDFGIARPQGMETTFGGLLVGTPGYAAPEQASFDEQLVGPWTDVFGFAALAYEILTGEPYFQFATAMDAMAAVRATKRRSVRDAKHVCPDLAARPHACDALDRALALGTAPKRDQRPQRADMLAAMILPVLRTDSERTLARARPTPPRDAFFEEDTSMNDWSFVTRSRSGAVPPIRSLAWDGDGGCFALTAGGSWFWTGFDWVAAPPAGLPPASDMRFVHRVAAGRWLMGGAHATLTTYAFDGAGTSVHGPDPSVVIELASGELDDIAVMAASRPGAPPFLFAMVARRWMRPVEVPGMAAITVLARIGDAAWLVGGRGDDGRGRFVSFHPLELAVRPIPIDARFGAPVSASGHPSGEGWIAPCEDGGVLRMEGTRLEAGTIPDEPRPCASAVDPAGGSWIGGSRGVWFRRGGSSGDTWTLLNGRGPSAPQLVSLVADVGLVRAVDATGGLIEGRQTV